MARCLLDFVAPGGVYYMQLDAEFLQILACPSCRGSVREEKEGIVCVSCGRRYPIRDGIPVMLVEESSLGGSTGNNKA